MGTTETLNGYLLGEYTLAELQNIVKDEGPYNSKVIVKYDVNNINEMTKEQQEIQQENRWCNEYRSDMRVREETIYKVVEDEAFKLVFGGYKDNIVDKLYDTIMNSKIKIVGTIVKYNNEEDNDRVRVEYVWDNGKRTDDLGFDEEKVEFNLSTDLEEFQTKLKNVKQKSSFSSDKSKRKDVLLEKFTITVYPYSFKDIDGTVKKIIKKFIRSQLTYCLKLDKVIVPQEYLDKGKDGIKEWRDIKSSNNKNNSIEKRMLKQILKDKRQYAYRAMLYVMGATIGTNRDWRIPVLELDGRYNTQKTMKLISKLINTKDKQTFLQMTEDDIVNKFKEYWKQTLMDAYNEVDKFSKEEIK